MKTKRVELVEKYEGYEPMDLEVKKIELVDHESSLVGRVEVRLPGKMNWLLKFPIFENEDGYGTMFPGEYNNGDNTYYNICPEAEGHWIEQHSWAGQLKALILAVFELFMNEWTAYNNDNSKSNCANCKWKGYHEETYENPRGGTQERTRCFCKVTKEYIDENYIKYFAENEEMDEDRRYNREHFLRSEGYACPHHTWMFQTKEGKWVVREPYPNNAFVESLDEKIAVRLADVRLVVSEHILEGIYERMIALLAVLYQNPGQEVEKPIPSARESDKLDQLKNMINKCDNKELVAKHYAEKLGIEKSELLE